MDRGRKTIHRRLFEEGEINRTSRFVLFCFVLSLLWFLLCFVFLFIFDSFCLFVFGVLGVFLCFFLIILCLIVLGDC